MTWNVLIVGGGIGGLSLARELTLRGVRPAVLEKAPQLNPVGAGIIMNPNAMAVLERNGLADEVRRESWPYLMRETRDARGRLLATRDYQPLYASGKLAQGALVHRAHLLDVLYGSLPPGTVRFGSAVPGIEGLGADLVVGADGIHSQVRRETFGEIPPRYMGYRSHRMVVENPGVRCFTEYLGRGQRVGLVPISEKRLYVWTTFNAAPDAAPPAELSGFFRQFTDATVRRVLQGPLENVITTDVEELSIDAWSRGRVALLGDAAHALTPNIGQGAGMAMEDAAVLAEEMATAKEITLALANYEKRRRPRVETVMRVSREVGEEGQKSSAFACWLRNRRVARAGRDVARAQADLVRLLAFPG